MLQFNVFPGGKRKAVTFSYDDGHDTDIRLVSLFNKYGVKATFHLNGGSMSEEKLSAWRELYRGHEISCHTVSHGWPTIIPEPSLMREVLDNREALERVAGYPVVGMSYPYGDFSDYVIKVMKACGIVYSRTVNDLPNYKLPQDFMRWHPTCHHKNAAPHIAKFLSNIDYTGYESLLYIWGHSHEFREESQWAEFEENLKAIAGNDKIWYATNIEIYNYVTAQRRLVFSTDAKTVYNPSAISVWVEKDRGEVIEIAPGETVNI